MHKLCAFCGESFTAKRERARYCSGRCRAASARGSTLEKRREPTGPQEAVFSKVCTSCGAHFMAKQNRAIYCSDACRTWAHLHPGRPRVPRPSARVKAPPAVRMCKNCGEALSPTSKRRVFCSTRCAQWARCYPGETMSTAWKNGERRRKLDTARRPCPQCGEMFAPKRKSMGAEFTVTCSHECGMLKRYGVPPGGSFRSHNASRRELEKSRPGLGRNERINLLRGWVDEGRSCAYCSEPATTVDHVYPLHLGGTNLRQNLVPACRPCNTSKGRRTLEEWVRHGGSLHGLRDSVPRKTGVGSVLF